MEVQNIQKADFIHTPVIDQVGVNDRVARLNSRSIKKDSKMAALNLALSMIDLTTLEGMDTPGKSVSYVPKQKKCIPELIICLMWQLFVCTLHWFG